MSGSPSKTAFSPPSIASLGRRVDCLRAHRHRPRRNENRRDRALGCRRGNRPATGDHAPDYLALLDAVARLVRELDRAAGEAGTVGMGIPGAVVPHTGLVKNANSVWLNGRPLGRDLEERLDRPVRLMNDANCFALSEASDGAAAGAHVVFGVILGTGVGGGIVVDGRCLSGANLIAGEWGHNPLPWLGAEESPGPPCYCGKRGCVETWLSGPALERDHAEHTGLTLSSREIVRAAAGGDPGAAATLARYQDRLGRT